MNPAAVFPRHPRLLTAETSVLVVVDMQDALLSAMAGRENLLNNVLLLVRAAKILNVPIIATTQNAPRLGTVEPELVKALGEDVVTIDKMCFSCAQSAPFMEALTATRKKQMVVCGVETHICVSQTAHDLLHKAKMGWQVGCQVHVAADAVSSRTVEKHKLGMERIRVAGILPCAAEAAVYEWLGEAGTPAFREILKLVR